MRRFTIEIIEALYQGSIGIPGTDIYDTREWNGLILPIELPTDYKKEKEKRMLATIYISGIKGERDNFFLIRTAEAIQAARFQKKWNIAKAFSKMPCHYIGILKENCRVIIDSGDENLFSQEEIHLLTELALRVNISVFDDVNLLKEIWKVHGFVLSQREHLFMFKKSPS